MIYCGIGSRNTPLVITNMMRQLAKLLAENGAILRSGHALGADQAFEQGCDSGEGEKEIFLPWKGFYGSESNLVVEDKRAFKIAEKYHPAWDKLGDGARKLMARNSHQVLGLDLNTPCDFIVCHTKNGKGDGGTGQALRIARDYNIPIFDFGSYPFDTQLEISQLWAIAVLFVTKYR